ncbi:MAG: ATP-binding protein, partial [Candidatus Limnocylindrales bacterium]
MSSRLVSPTVIGRDRELAAVDAALSEAAVGRPTHLLIAGEAGVGKSRLVAEIAARATAHEMRFLVGGCANVGDGGLPYGPILD